MWKKQLRLLAAAQSPDLFIQRSNDGQLSSIETGDSMSDCNSSALITWVHTLILNVKYMCNFTFYMPV